MKESADSAFVDRLRRCMEQVGGGNELARRSSIPRRTLENYLSGGTDPTRTRLVQMAKAAGVSVHWLSTGEGPMRPEETPPPAKPPEPPPPSPPAEADDALLGEVAEAIDTLYKNHGLPLTPKVLIPLATHKARAIAAVSRDPAQRKVLIDLMVAQLRAEIGIANDGPATLRSA